MKLTLVIGLLFLSTQVFASNLALKAAVDNPVVIGSDFIMIQEDKEIEILAPWIRSGIDFRNRTFDVITISEVKYEAKITGEAEYSFERTFDAFELGGLIEIGSMDTIRRVFWVEQLPQSESSLQVRVTVKGWDGAAASPENRIEEVLHFATK